WVIPMHNIWNVLILLIMTVIGVLMTMNGEAGGILLFLLVVLALFYGVFFVFPIGGADMPVVISLLNSLTGLSAAAAGAIYDNKAMLIGGVLVGASGTILTLLMCKAMNRSIWNV